MSGSDPIMMNEILAVELTRMDLVRIAGLADSHARRIIRWRRGRSRRRAEAMAAPWNALAERLTGLALGPAQPFPDGEDTLGDLEVVQVWTDQHGEPCFRFADGDRYDGPLWGRR